MPDSGQHRAKAGQSPVLPDGLSAARVRRELQKILAGAAFAQSDRMSRFLRFVVEESLAGRADSLKEFSIGMGVFDREASFDPRIDPIVRVEARRLRAKLRQYYESEGRDDDVVIALAKGRYAPRFVRRSEVPEEPKAAGERTIAVLPFANLSADPQNEYFSDGLTEELIHALTKVEGLRVVAWSSAAQLKGAPHDIYDVARTLRVSTVLNGSVRQWGDRLRITAQLVDTSNGFYLWSETFDRRLEDVFAIQDEISRAIAGVLEVQLVSGAPAAGRRGSPHNLEAYDLYLKGRFFWNRRTREGMSKSIECFEQAIAAAPDFPLAYAGLADAHSVLVQYGLERPTVAMPKAKAAALKALELDPTLAEANTSLGFIRSLYEWEWADAEDYYRRAIRLNPGYATAHHWYGIDYLALTGRLEEAREQLRIARRLDPLSSAVNEGEPYICLFERRFGEALQLYRQLLEMDPGFYRAYTSCGRVYAQMGLYEQAIAMLEKGRMLAGDIPNILGALGQVHALAGQSERARQFLDDLAEISRKEHVATSCFALIHLGLGEQEKAIEWLEKGCELRELQLASLKMHPAYDALRSEPRFAALVRRIGL